MAKNFIEIKKLCFSEVQDSAQALINAFRNYIHSIDIVDVFCSSRGISSILFGKIQCSLVAFF